MQNRKPLTMQQRDGLVKVIDTFLSNMQDVKTREQATLQSSIVIETIKLTLGYLPDGLTLDNLKTFRDNIAQQGTIEDN